MHADEGCSARPHPALRADPRSGRGQALSRKRARCVRVARCDGRLGIVGGRMHRWVIQRPRPRRDGCKCRGVAEPSWPGLTRPPVAADGRVKPGHDDRYGVAPAMTIDTGSGHDDRYGVAPAAYFHGSALGQAVAVARLGWGSRARRIGVVPVTMAWTTSGRMGPTLILRGRRPSERISAARLRWRRA